MKIPEQMGIYIHVPFCVRKCQYCDFLSFSLGETEKVRKTVREDYVQALCREIRAGRFPVGETTTVEKEKRNLRNKPVVASVFFGGGTPSLLSGEQIGRILTSVRETYQLAENAEISMEANPGTVSRESLTEYREAGINRLSIGLQSAQNRELALLGRIHTWEEFRENYQIAREVGFLNINIDLMSALPGQTLESWEETLAKVLELEPEHISAYSLIIEEGTPFYEKYGEDAEEYGEQCVGKSAEEERLPDEEAERRMYEVTEECLNRAGFYRYEISNYAKPGFECRHNSFYWKRVPYLGFGLGASSFYEETRWRNQPDLKKYLRIWGTNEYWTDLGKKQIQWQENAENLEQWQDVEHLTREDQMAEFMFLGLRMMEGIKEQDFAETFGRTLDEVYGAVLTRQEQLGLIERRDGRVKLTAYGIDVSNQVFCDYI